MGRIWETMDFKDTSRKPNLWKRQDICHFEARSWAYFKPKHGGSYSKCPQRKKVSSQSLSPPYGAGANEISQNGMPNPGPLKNTQTWPWESVSKLIIWQSPKMAAPWRVSKPGIGDLNTSVLRCIITPPADLLKSSCLNSSKNVLSPSGPFRSMGDLNLWVNSTQPVPIYALNLYTLEKSHLFSVHY